MAPPSRSDSAVDALPVNQPTKLFIGGITKSTTTKQLREHFQQYGRVLDCIAMRQADGRSRGFGYVTLDSRAAAEKCLIMPQVVDNRVVDVKMAVPEGTSLPSAPTTPMSASSPPFTPVAFGGLWSNAYHGASTGASAFSFDSTSWGYPTPSLDCFDVLSSLDQPEGFGDSDLVTPSVQAEPMSVRSTLLENNHNAISKVATGEPRRALGDITNKTQNSSVGEKKPLLASDPEMEEDEMVRKKNTKQDSEVASWDSGVQLMLANMDPASVAVTNKELPSVGSALHASGECHRCNFFSKGRCANGRDCSFCHFEHEKRKVSRQEKRERREKWLAQQAAQEDSRACSESERSESQDSLQSESLRVRAKRLDGSAAPPGLSPMKPAEDLGESTPLNMPLVPPGAFLPSILATSPSASLSSLRPPPLQLLSTTPSPMPTPLASGKCASPAFSAVGLEHAFTGHPARVTVATQTEHCEACELCGQCAHHCASGGCAESSWSKEELLRFRSKPPAVRRIGTMPMDQLRAL